MRNIVLLILLILTSSLHAQNFDRIKMDSLFSIIESKDKAMVSYSIFSSGKEVYKKSIGFADIENNIKASEKTKYRIGSISKMFTATLIMQLIDEKKLTFNTKLSKYYPEIANSEDITIEQLLRHRSGIFNFTNASDYSYWMEDSITKVELIKKIVSYGNVFWPDEKTEYSNSNYVLLSFIIEEIKQNSFSDIIYNKIIKPCGLTNTYYGADINTTNNEAKSYVKNIVWTEATETNMAIPVGAGAIVSTPSDLNIFITCLFAGKLFSKKSLKIMQEVKTQYGIGMFKVPFYEKVAYGHTGGVDGFQSILLYFLDDNMSISYTANGVDIPMNDILIGVLNIYFDRDYILPTFAELTSEDLDKYLGVYSSPTFPLKITVSKMGNKLIVQATDQASFPVEPYGLHKFKFYQAGISLEFIPSESVMMFIQGGVKSKLNKEK